MRSPLDGLKAARALGWGKAWDYLRYQLQLRTGAVRGRTRIGAWDEVESASPERWVEGRFFFDHGLADRLGGQGWSEEARRHARTEAEAVLQGRFRLFGLHQVDLGFPPAWNRFPPLPGSKPEAAVPSDRHWSEYDLDELPSDVKLLWELSRFAWAFSLGRGYLWTQQGRYAEGFWQLFESWRDANPPNCGPQWISAQEVALRLLALVFVRAAFRDWLAHRPEEERSLLATIGAHASRIPPTLAYSRAQGNNHLLAEGVGLFTAGVMLSGLPQARRWRAEGRVIVEGALRDQVFSDGGYIQHSTNYQRLALELGVWAAVLAEKNGEPLAQKSLAKLRRCGALLGELAQPENGRTPNFGPNDGAHLLALTSCGFEDYRPTLQAAAAALGGLQGWGEGQWSEILAWLGLDKPESDRQGRNASVYPDAGLVLIGHDSAQGMLRAARFSSRPGHIDQLHLDLWAGGRNLSLDPGTYLYNGEPPWENRLADAAAHNGPVVDGCEPMRRVSRFLWLDWSAAKLVEHRRTEDETLELAITEHDGYERLGVGQRRTVIRAGDHRWIVFDDLLGSAHHTLSLGWLLPQGKYELEEDGLMLELEGAKVKLHVGPGEHALYRAGERIWGPAPPFERRQWGWYSPTYALRQPALHWVTWLEGSLPKRMRSEWTIGSPGMAPPQLEWGAAAETGLPDLQAVILGGHRLELGN